MCYVKELTGQLNDKLNVSYDQEQMQTEAKHHPNAAFTLCSQRPRHVANFGHVSICFQDLLCLFKFSYFVLR